MSSELHASTLRSKSVDELKTTLSEFKRELLNLRFQKATKQLEAPSRIKKVRRAVARIKTLLTEKVKESAK